MSDFSRKDHTTKWIAVKALSVLLPEAQRSRFDEARARKIGRELDPDKFGVIHVTKPDKNGIHHIIDGHHRVSGVRFEWGEDQKVPCYVLDIDAADTAKAADAFLGLNTDNRRNISAVDNFKAAVKAGRPDQVAINDLVTKLGYKISPAKEDGVITAVGALQQVYRQYGSDILRHALLVIQGTWGTAMTATDGTIIAGFARFLHHYHTGIDKQRLVDKVGKEYTPSQFLGAARNVRDTFRGTMPESVERLLVTIYNHRLRGNHLEEFVGRKANGEAKKRKKVVAKNRAALDTHAGIG